MFGIESKMRAKIQYGLDLMKMRTTIWSWNRWNKDENQVSQQDLMLWIERQVSNQGLM